MQRILKRVFNRIRTSLLPTAHEKEVSKWFAVNGDENMRLDYELNSNSLVLDFGGYKGQWASDIYSRYNCSILIFEPVKSFADKIEKRFLLNPKIKVFCLALGASSREELIALNEDGTSLYKNSLEKVNIHFEDAVSFFASNNIKNIDLMKVNIEGGEYELLPRLLESDIISKIKNIQIQFHDIATDSEERMNKIQNELLKTHALTYQFKFVWENWKLKDANDH